MPRWFRPDNFIQFIPHKPAQRFLEIGTFEGDSARYLLDHWDCHVTTIDPCQPYPIPGYEELIGERLLPIIQQTLSPYGERCRFIHGKSQDVLPTLLPAQYDFIYVDGDHRRDAVWQDAVLSWPLLAADGLIIFDDYLWGLERGVEFSPRDALDRFVREYPAAVVFCNDQLGLRKA